MTVQVFVKELLGDGLSTKQGFAWSGFLRVYTKLVRQLDAELQGEQGLSLVAYEVLLFLALAPGRRLKLSELAATTVLSLSGMFRLVERLEREGLVRREADHKDHRVTNVLLTETGFKRLRAAHTIYIRGIRDHFLCHFSSLDLTILALFWRRFTHPSQSGENRTEDFLPDARKAMVASPLPAEGKVATDDVPRGRGRPRKGGANAARRKGFEVTFDARTLALLDDTTDNRSEYLERIALEHLLAQNQELTQQCMLELHERYKLFPDVVSRKLQEIESSLGVMAAYEASETLLLFEQG